MSHMFLRADLSEKLARVQRSASAPSVQQRSEFMASRAARPKYAARVDGARSVASADPENYAVVGNVAQICVEGVLSEEPDFWSWLMGCDGSTYRDIRDAFALAGADPMVKSVVLDVCSPGGYTDGMFETLAAIEAFSKPITVQASLACSAAYALAAMAGPITALGPASEFGSIGVLQVHKFYADEEIVNVTNSDAPNKRPDARTPEGKAVIVAELDASYELFADAIARGRSNATGKKYTVDQVSAEFGRGAVMLADAARAAGLIDKMPRAVKRGGSSAEAREETLPESTPPIEAAAEPQPASASAVDAPKPQSPSRGTGPIRTIKMDESAFKAQHPDLYALVFGKGEAAGHAKGIEVGTKAEHKRVSDHLNLATISPAAMKVASAAILSGASVSDSHAEYLKLSLSAHETAARQADSDEAGRVLDGSKAPVASTTALDNSDLVAAAMGLSLPKKVA